MSPGLPASKLLVLALSKAILTIVFILWNVFASSFSPHVPSSFLVASDIIPPAEKTQGDEASIGERPGVDSSPLNLLEVFCGLPDDVKR